MIKRALRLKRAGVRRPLLVDREAKRAGLRLADACAMLQNETGIPQRNIFGCDHGATAGRPPYCQEAVTRARVVALLRSGKANGVGWTQLTYLPFVRRAEALGGAHRVRNQVRVGFEVLADNQKRFGRWGGFKAYNGAGQAAEDYADRAVRRADGWQRVIDGKQSHKPV